MLKIKIDKVTVIRVTKCPFLALLPCTVLSRTRIRTRFAAVGRVGFLAWFRARARGIFLRESLSKVAAAAELQLLLL